MVVFVVLPAVILILHSAGIPAIVEAIAWTMLVGWLLIRAGSALRRAMTMLLMLGLHVALLLSGQGVETVRTLNEMSPYSRFWATLGWISATAVLAFVLADATRALLRRPVGGRTSGDELLTRLMVASPFLAVLCALPLSHGNGLVGLFDDSVGNTMKSVFGITPFPTLWSILTSLVWIITYIIVIGALFAVEFDLDWLDENIPLNRHLNLSVWPFTAAILLVGLFVVLCVWHGPSIMPSPTFLACWLAAVIVALACLRAIIQWGRNELFEKAVVAPVVVLLVTWAIVLSALDLNDNHELAYRRDMSWRPAPPGAGAFREWLDFRLKKANPPPAVPTVFVVAAEGGGARAAYMTALTLEVLRQHCPQFAEWHFATIGVSGGSVGTALSAASEVVPSGNCQLPPQEINPDGYIAAKVAGTDLLGPSLRSLLLSDLLLRLWPGSFWRSNGKDGIYKVENSPLGWVRDRAQHIERTLSDAWPLGLGGSDPLGERLFSRFSPFPPERGGNRPALVLLTTDVASGRRIAFSHVRFRDGPSQPPYSGYSQFLLPPPPCRSPADEARAPSELRARLLTFDDIAPGRDTTLLAAAVASARFPIISSAATLPCPEPDWRVVDGGYFENSGLTTALELINHIARGASAANRKVRVVLIRLENGEATTSSSDTANRTQKEDGPTASDLRTPMQAFMATRDARADNARSIADRAADKGVQKFGPGCPASHARDCVRFEQFIIKLQRCNIPIPLGWSLSAAARADIARQLGLIKNRPEDLAWWNNTECMDKIALKNREKLEQIMQRAAAR